MNAHRDPIDHGPDLEAEVALILARQTALERRQSLTFRLIKEFAQIMSAEFDALNAAIDAAVSAETAAAAKVRELTEANAALTAENEALKAANTDPAELQALTDKLTPPTSDLTSVLAG